MTLRNYIGLASSVNDPAVAIVRSDGRVVFAEATERAMQYKHALLCPPDPLSRIGKLIDEYCEPGAEIVAARSWSESCEERWDAGTIESATVLAGGEAASAGGPTPLGYFAANHEVWHPCVTSCRDQSGIGLAFRVREASPAFDAEVVWRSYDHHSTHAAYACASSPYREALCAVFDGFGEGTALGFFRFEGGRLHPIEVPPAMGSLGMFYILLTWICGFDPLEGEEWKVMGLASYGKRDEAIYSALRSILEVDGLSVRFAPDAGARIAPFLSNRPSPENALEMADLAHTGQAIFADVATEVLSNLYRHGRQAGFRGSGNLVLAGGCAQNSAFNGQILERTPFDRLHVPPAPGDDGNAVGAALLAFQEDGGQWRDPAVASAYLGSRFAPEAVTRVRELGGLASGLRPGEDVVERAADLLAAGKIIGWVQGRAEFGPRALGNRSILADPRDPEVKERLNASVKFREAFRPFAPSVLHEQGPRYFEDYQESRYMERTLRFRKEMMRHVPGVVHVDGTGRIQSVKQEWNPRFHALIQAFERRTGVPILLNTSFNVMGKPIVHAVEDALAVFFSSGLDALVIDDELFEK